MKAVNSGLLAIGVLVVSGFTLYSTRGSEKPTSPKEQPIKAHSIAKASPAVSIAPSRSAPPDPAPHGDGAQAQASPSVIPVSREFDRIFRNQRPGASTASTIKMHAKIEQQRRDPDWASQTEQAYRNYFQGQPDLLVYGSPEVNCRETLCELRLVAHGADKATEWTKILMKPGSMPWPAGGIPVVVNWDYQGGVTAVIVHTMFQRRIVP